MGCCVAKNVSKEGRNYEVETPTRPGLGPTTDLGQQIVEPVVEVEEVPYVKNTDPKDDPNLIFKAKLKEGYEGKELKDVKMYMGNDDAIPQLKTILQCQMDTTEMMINQNEFFTPEHNVSTVNAKAKQEECKTQMSDVNNLNWQYLILQENKKLTPINDFESMMVGLRVKKIKEDPSTPKIERLVSLGLTINLYSSIVTNKQGKLKVLKKSANNSRSDRVRPADTSKQVVSLVLKERNAFQDKIGAYAKEWAQTYYGNENHKPSFNEVVEGLFNWFNGQLQEDIKGKTKQEQVTIINTSKKTFNELIKAAGIKNANVNMTDLHDPEIGFRNPYSKIICFTLMLYSMEFGSPPLYVVLNQAIRDWDLTHLKNLGPYAQCLLFAGSSCEMERDPGDQIPKGKTIQETLGGQSHNMAGVYMLYRGAQMKDQWIQPYEQNVVFDNPTWSSNDRFDGYPHFVRFPGNTSCTQELAVAFDFAFKGSGPDYTPTIFVINVKNYGVPAGIRLNSEAYTAYPSEGEVLVPDGTRTWILKVQRGFTIKNGHPGWRYYTGTTINIIYCFIG